MSLAVWPNVQYRITCNDPDCKFFKMHNRCFESIQIWVAPKHECMICGSEKVTVVNTHNKNEWHVL